MDVKCVFENHILSGGDSYYGCCINNLLIPENAKLKFLGKHLEEMTNDDVGCVYFLDCTISKVPQGLTKSFPNMKVLNIHNSNLSKISKEDLSEYKNLERFLCEGNKLEFLPGDLFEDYKNLEWVSFFGNKLKVVEPNILDGLNKLKLTYFNKNPNYDCFFSAYFVHNAKQSLQEVKDQLFETFSATDPQLVKNYHKEAQNLTQKGLLGDLLAFIQDEKKKDFKIQIDDQEFHVHKLLLTIRSPTLAEILRNNPEVENLNLVDIPVEIFKKILKFLYTDELPEEDGTNFLNLFVAANRLQIKELKNFAAEKILNRINPENALDIFKMSNKYEQEELKQKSFKEIKKKYPKIEFKDEWALNPEKVAEVIENYEKMEEEIQKNCNQIESLLL